MASTISFPGRFESLVQISQYVLQAAREAGLNPKAAYAVELAVDEACANIIDHAYGGEDKGEIECSCIPEPGNLRVVLRDHGRPFDPSNTPQLDPKARLEDCSCGGAGLVLIRNLVDEVHYEFSPSEGNVCTLVKGNNGKDNH